jgi:hypothetical protein
MTMNTLAQRWQRRQRWWCQRNEGNNTSATTATTPARWGQQRQRNEGNNASATTKTMPARQGQRGCHCNDDKDTPKMPAWQGWQHQRSVGNNASARTFGSCSWCYFHCHCCWVVFVIFSEAKKELVLEFWGGLAGKSVLMGLILRPSIYWITLYSMSLVSWALRRSLYDTNFYELSGTKKLADRWLAGRLYEPLQWSSPSHCQMPPPWHQQPQHTDSLRCVSRFALSHHLWRAPDSFLNA